MLGFGAPATEPSRAMSSSTPDYAVRSGRDCLRFSDNSYAANTKASIEISAEAMCAGTEFYEATQSKCPAISNK